MPSADLGATVTKIGTLLGELQEQFTVLGDQITAIQRENNQVTQTNLTLTQQLAESSEAQKNLVQDNARLVRESKNRKQDIRALRSETKKFNEERRLWGLKEDGFNQRISGLTLQLQTTSSYPGQNSSDVLPIEPTLIGSADDQRPKGLFVCGSEHPEQNSRYFDDLCIAIPDINWGKPKVLHIGKSTAVDLTGMLSIVAILAGTLSHPEINKVKNQAKARRVRVEQALTMAPLIENVVQALKSTTPAR